MNRSTSMRHLYVTLAVLLMALTSCCLCRPQSTIDSQDGPAAISPELESGIGVGGGAVNWRKFYPGYEPIQSKYQSLIEEATAPGSPLERFQLELLSRLAAAQQQNTIGGGGGGSGLPWEPMYRLPEMKRQVRYRQCYFNPISCFKK